MPLGLQLVHSVLIDFHTNNYNQTILTAILDFDFLVVFVSLL